MENIKKILCISCGAVEQVAFNDEGKFECHSCQEKYDVIDDVPCIVHYQSDEVLSLIEILSNLDTKRTPPTKDMYNNWIEILNVYHHTDDKNEYLKELGGSYKQYMPHRYRQYSVLMEMLEDLNIKGKEVLDVGAGEGFDTAIFNSLGCNMVAVEFSPISASLGKVAVPEAQWFTGSVHALPFASNSFDIVVCQAAVHHFIDVPAAFLEMLRVLKIGGTLLSVSDSYRPITSTEDTVLKQFNNDPAVLRGVNEGIPNIDEFFESINKFGNKLDTLIYTSMIYNFINSDGKKSNLEGIHKWSYPEDFDCLKSTAGGISLKVKKLDELDISLPKLKKPVCRPSDLAKFGVKKNIAIANISKKIPEEFVNLLFPGDVGNSKFQLLNGWRIRDYPDDFRTAYFRCRWFFSRSSHQQSLRIIVSTCESVDNNKLKIYIGNKLKTKINLTHEYSTVELSIEEQNANETFACEMILESSNETFNNNLFKVKELCIY